MVWTAVNRIAVETPDEADGIVERFRHRAGKVDLQPGFRGFELWREDSGKEVLVITRWERKQDFEAWANGPAFREAHARAEGSPGSSSGSVYQVMD
ncbi:MAG: antibiotic biosynthesis monooxygenase [Thermoplasmata archaeon]|nr:antibiotic biosynthesis monooxygenase [Thermoplasmata archaeon]